MPYENKPESEALPNESKERLYLINETMAQLQSLSDFHLETEEGREGFKLALGLIFSSIEKIEGDGEYEIVGEIKDRIRIAYTELYEIEFDGTLNTPEAGKFYGEIYEIMELIETRGARFVEDMEIYKNSTEERKAA